MASEGEKPVWANIADWENWHDVRLFLDGASERAVKRTCLACVKELTVNPLHVCADDGARLFSPGCVLCVRNSTLCEVIPNNNMDTISHFVNLCHTLRADKAKPTQETMPFKELKARVDDYKLIRNEIVKLLNPTKPEVLPAGNHAELMGAVKSLREDMNLALAKVEEREDLNLALAKVEEREDLKLALAKVEEAHKSTLERIAETHKSTLRQIAGIHKLLVTGNGEAEDRPLIDFTTTQHGVPPVTGKCPSAAEWTDFLRNMHRTIDELLSKGLAYQNETLDKQLRLFLKLGYISGRFSPDKIYYDTIQLQHHIFRLAFPRWFNLSAAHQSQVWEYYCTATNNKGRYDAVSYFESDAIFSDGKEICILPRTYPPSTTTLASYIFRANRLDDTMGDLPEHSVCYENRYLAQHIASCASKAASSHLDAQLIVDMNSSAKFRDLLLKFEKFQSMDESERIVFTENYWQKSKPSERYVLLEGLIHNFDIRTSSKTWRTDIVTAEHEARFMKDFPGCPNVTGGEAEYILSGSRNRKRAHSETEPEGNGD